MRIYDVPRLCLIIKQQCINKLQVRRFGQHNHFEHHNEKIYMSLCGQRRRRSGSPDNIILLFLNPKFNISSWFLWMSMSVSYLIGNPKDRFSRDKAHFDVEEDNMTDIKQICAPREDLYLRYPHKERFVPLRAKPKYSWQIL